MFKKLFVVLIIVIFGATVLFFLGAFLMSHTASNSVISNFLQNYKVEFAIWRYSLFILLMIFWRPLIIWWGCNRNWPKRHIINVLQLRTKVVIFFLLFELVFVLNGLGWFLGLF